MTETKIVLPLREEGVPPVTDSIVAPPVLTELVIGTDKYNVNPAGDAVDNTGKIIRTKAELEILKTPVQTEEEKQKLAAITEKTTAINARLIEGAEVEIEDDKGVSTKYKLNKDGAVIDATGKVLKTKDELRAMMLEAENDPDNINYVTEIQKATNLIITEQNTGNPITYENTIPGLTQYAKDLHNNGIQLGRTQYEQELTTKFPILNDIIQHLTIKGSLDGFNEEEDYSKITISDDEAQQTEIYTKAKLQQGMSQAEITTMLGYLKTDKKLKEASEIGLTYLKTNQEANKVDRATKAAEVRASEELERTKYWTEVNSIINSKQLKVGDKKFVIPDIIRVKTEDGKIVNKTVKDFQDYIEKPVTFKIDGQFYTMTQLEFDEYNEDIKRTPHNDVFDAFRKFIKNDDAQIISANVNNDIVKNIIKLKTKAGGVSSDNVSKTGKLNVPIK